MIETQSIYDLVETQIKEAVDQQVSQILAQEQWLADIETRIIAHVQARINARFANISTLPDLVQTVQDRVKDLLESGKLPGIDAYIDQHALKHSIDNSIQDLVISTIDNLMIDPQWLGKMEKSISQDIVNKVGHKLNDVDFLSIASVQVDQALDRWSDRFRQEFGTNGINDTATQTEITVADGTVTVSNDLSSRGFTADIASVTDLNVGNLVVRGTVNTDNASWKELKDSIASDAVSSLTEQWKSQLVSDVLSLAKTSGIEFDEILLGDEPLIKNNYLNANVVGSNLRTVGQLNDLTVTGACYLGGDTVTINKKRLGINTRQPEMALSVWDEEVSIIGGKLSKNLAYLGTSRLQNLSIGINRVPFIELDTDGVTTVKKLKIDRNRIEWGSEVPGYSGAKGDIVFNSDCKPDAPFAWICLGAYRWMPLKGNQ